VRLLPLVARLREVPRQTAVLGLDEEGVPLLLRLPSPEVGHVLVAGTTGSGKTALARSMAVSLALANRQGEVQLVVIDPKGRGYGVLEGLPHLLRPVVRETYEAAYVLSELVGEMLRRDREKVQEPRLVVVIDEMADLVEAGGLGVARSITRLTQRGREAGLHVIGCTQKPTVEAIGSLVKSNFPVRLVGSVASPEDAKVASGLKETGAERLLGRGDFLLVVKGQVTRFQAAYVSQQEMQAVVAKLCTVSPQSRRWPAEQLAATGTDGQDRQPEPANGRVIRSEWTDPQRMVGTVARQLRLIK
jgi:S-DNA-T family DNA segregation ATPase FtsK/SpoIIIE